MTRPISSLILPVIFALSTLLILPCPAFSSDPVAPPFEGALITNTTNIDVVGTFREDENFTHDQSAGEATIIIKENCTKTTEVYISPIDQAKTRYTDEVRSTDGHTTFVKDFSFNTHPGDGNPNIETDRAIGFEAIPGSTSGTIQSKEKGAVSIFHLLGFNACVEGTEQGHLVCINANNEYLGIAGGSAFFASSLSAHTETELTTTSTPSVHHAVYANGKGTAESELLFNHTEGGSVAVTDDCANMDCPGRGGSHMVVFNEKTSANGIFSAFHKDLYAGVVEQYQAPQSSFFSGLITLDSLCPFVP